SEAHKIAVGAFAGTGKTSMLEGFAMQRPNERMLYIAFNRPVAQEAAARFPTNVVCKTSHALAFRTHGAQFQHKLGNVNTWMVCRALGHLPPYRELDDATRFALATTALKVVMSYLHSGDFALGLQHLS